MRPLSLSDGNEAEPRLPRDTYAHVRRTLDDALAELDLPPQSIHAPRPVEKAARERLEPPALRARS
jgi:hypothetical protein